MNCSFFSFAFLARADARHTAWHRPDGNGHLGKRYDGKRQFGAPHGHHFIACQDNHIPEIQVLTAAREDLRPILQDQPVERYLVVFGGRDRCRHPLQQSPGPFIGSHHEEAATKHKLPSLEHIGRPDRTLRHHDVERRLLPVVAIQWVFQPNGIHVRMDEVDIVGNKRPKYLDGNSTGKKAPHRSSARRCSRPAPSAIRVSPRRPTAPIHAHQAPHCPKPVFSDLPIGIVRKC